MKKYFCTYFDANFIVKGLTMHRSLLKYETAFKLFILCFDAHTYALLSKMNLQSVELIKLEDFEDEELLKAKQTRNKVEYYWTCTPSLPLYILNKNPEINLITYLDSDLFFFSGTDAIFEEFNNSSILITEHRYAKVNKYQENKNGKYNVQYLTFKRDPEGLKALGWWRDRCIEWCYQIPEGNKMGDQKYLDDWTSRFKNVCVLQNIGAGLAPWNIAQYNINIRAGESYVNDTKLIFYHFGTFTILNNSFICLSAYKLRKTDKLLVYKPYIDALEETFQTIKRFEPDFSHYNKKIKIKRLKELIWLVKSILNLFI